MNYSVISSIGIQLRNMRAAVVRGGTLDSFYHFSCLCSYLYALRDSGAIDVEQLSRLLDLSQDAFMRSHQPPPWPVAGAAQ